MQDLRVMMKVSGKPVVKKQLGGSSAGQREMMEVSGSDVRIEDGRLWYDKKWYGHCLFD